MQIKFTHGDVDEAFSVMQEAAQWLIDKGEPMWAPSTITREKIKNPPEEFIVGYADGKSAVAMTLSFFDPFF